LQNYSNSRTHPKEEEEEEVGVCAFRLLNFKMMELLKKVNSFGKEKKKKETPHSLPHKKNASSRNVWILGRLSFFHIF
jgi:hypothetical protein